MKYIKLFENFENSDKIKSKVPNATDEDIKAAVEDGLFFGFDKGLKIASVFYGEVKNKYNTSDDPQWPNWTAVMQDNTKLGYMFEDGYWEKVN